MPSFSLNDLFDTEPGMAIANVIDATLGEFHHFVEVIAGGNDGLHFCVCQLVGDSRGIMPCVPARADGEREWAARRAIVEHRFWNSLEFQGTKSYLVETGRERPDLTKLLSELLNQELTRQLGDLLDLTGAGAAQKTNPIPKATKTADENQISTIVVTQLDQSLTENWVAVEKTLLAKMPGGTWEPVWSNVVKVDASKPRKEVEEELANHAQVKQIRDAVKALGLPAGDEHLAIAIRFGAATMEAQDKSNAALDAFVKRYVQDLDQPPLILGTR